MRPGRIIKLIRAGAELGAALGSNLAANAIGQGESMVASACVAATAMFMIGKDNLDESAQPEILRRVEKRLRDLLDGQADLRQAIVLAAAESDMHEWVSQQRCDELLALIGASTERVEQLLAPEQQLTQRLAALDQQMADWCTQHDLDHTQLTVTLDRGLSQIEGHIGTVQENVIRVGSDVDRMASRIDVLYEALSHRQQVASEPAESETARLARKREIVDAIRQYELRNAEEIQLWDKCLPLQRLFQHLPLLRQLRESELPRGHSAHPDACSSQVLLDNDILRWEETAYHPQDPPQYESVSVDVVLQRYRHTVRRAHADVPRFVVLGPPGSGKSTLLQFLASRAASSTLHVAGRTPFPVSVRLPRWERCAPDASLPEYLARFYSQEIKPACSASDWHNLLSQGQAIVLLDGLDEISRDSLFEDMLRRTLCSYSYASIIVTCRTVSFEQYRLLLGQWPVFMLGALSPNQREDYVRSYPGSPSFDPEQLIEQLEGSPSLLPLAANPLLLSLICHTADGDAHTRIPTGRAKLIQGAIERVVAQCPCRRQISYPGAAPDWDEKLQVLERVALTLFFQKRRAAFSRGQFRSAVQTALREAGYGDAPAGWANALRDDFVHNSGLLREDALRGYVFLHLLIHEHLVASALARIIHTSPEGWNATIDTGTHRVTVRCLIDTRAWDPHWQEVIMLLVGQLSDPRPLLERLANPGPTETNPAGDDVFRHRLALAAMCTGEACARDTHRLRDVVSTICREAIASWIHHNNNHHWAVVEHLKRTLPIVAQVGYIDDAPLAMWLCWIVDTCFLSELQNVPDTHARLMVRDPAIKWPRKLDEFGFHVNRSTLLKRLCTVPSAWLASRHPEASSQENVRLSDDPESWMNWTNRIRDILDEDRKNLRLLGTTLQNMGKAAASRNLFLRLLLLAEHDVPLRDEERWVQVIVSIFGDARILDKEWSSELKALLGHENPRVRRAGVALLGRQMRRLEDSRWVLTAIAHLRDDESKETRAAVASAVGRCDTGAINEDVRELLQELLRDDSSEVRQAAAKTIGRLGPATASEETVRLVIGLLRNKDDRGAAKDALSGMARGAATPSYWKSLIALLRDEDKEYRECGLELIRDVPADADPPAAVCEALAEMLTDSNESIRRSGVEAIRLLRGVSPVLADLLVPLLESEIYETRRAAVMAAAHCVSHGANSPLDRLRCLLDGVDERVAKCVACYCPELGDEARRRGFSIELLLDSQDWTVRRDALHALEDAGAPAVTPAILERLPALLLDSHEYNVNVQSGAAMCIARLGAVCATDSVVAALSVLLTEEGFAQRMAALLALEGIGRDALDGRTKSRLRELVKSEDTLLSPLAQFILDGPGTPGDDEATELSDGQLRSLAARLSALGVVTTVRHKQVRRGVRRGRAAPRRQAVRARTGRRGGRWSSRARRIGDLRRSRRRLRPRTVAIRHTAKKPLSEEEMRIADKTMSSLREFGRRAALPEIIARLREFLGMPIPEEWLMTEFSKSQAKWTAARTFDNFHSLGLRFFERPDGTWEAREIERLSDEADRAGQ